MTGLSYGFLAALATLAGGAIVLAARKWSFVNRNVLLAFAAGVLIGLAFVEIFPEAYENSINAPLYLLAGFFVMYLIEQFAIPHHGHQHGLEHDHDHAEETELKTLGWLAWAGVLFHSLIDGLAIVSGSALDPHLAKSITAGVILHELPEGVLAASLLIESGLSRTRIMLLTAAVAFATPFGALLATLSLDLVGTDSIARFSTVAMALAGGTFVYVGVADMLHHAHAQKQGRVRAAVAFSAGLLLFVVESLVSRS